MVKTEPQQSSPFTTKGGHWGLAVPAASPSRCVAPDRLPGLQMQKCDGWFPGDEVKGNLRVTGKEALPDRSLIGDSDTKRHMNHTSRLPASVGF